MSAIILKILSIIGIILLALLGTALVILLLVLFFPVSYRVKGSKDVEQTLVKASAHWLFGLLSVRYDYPEPGRILVKALFFTIYDSGVEPKKKKAPSETAARNNAGGSKKAGDTPSSRAENTYEQAGFTEREPKEEQAEEASGIKDRIFAKYEKIKYTILKIYDRIKNILNHITYYRSLLEEEDTKELLKHAGMRLGKIWKNIRPAKLRADILFGASSPDTTGYLYAVYGMIYPTLGKYVLITPDFTKAVFTGTIDAAGHIMVFTILWNAAMLALDKRLRILIRKIKAHTKQCGNGE